VEKRMSQGTINRTTASTLMNETSSRSHMVIIIKFKQVYHDDLSTPDMCVPCQARFPRRHNVGQLISN
jgi:hypothetical protein